MTHWLHQLVIAQGGAAAPGGGWGMMVPLVLMFGIMYFLIIRPQQKKQKEQQTFLEALKSGDKVITQGGLLGRITEVESATVTLDLGNRTKVTVMRSHVLSLQADPASEETKSESDDKESK